jgi:hypothetical protein
MTKHLRVLYVGVVLAALGIALSVAAPKRTEAGVAAAVQVVNTLPIPVNIDTPARLPFAQTVSPGYPVGAQIAVPANKVWRIEYMSAICVVGSGNLVSFVLSNSLDSSPNVTNSYYFPVASTNFVNTFAVSQTTAIYADNTSPVSVALVGKEIAVDECSVTLSGYLVNP